MAPDSRQYRNRIELLQGTLDMLILQTLQRGARHGYGISQLLRARSGDVLQVETGSLYPALHRLERQGLSLQNGARPNKISARSSTALPPPVAVNLPRIAPNGRPWLPPSPVSSTLNLKAEPQKPENLPCHS
jgi:hypothetical protein